VYGYLLLRSTFFCIDTLVGRSVSLVPRFIDSGSQPSLNRSPQNLHTSLMWVKPENLPANLFYPTPKNLAGENLKYCQTFADSPSIGSA